MLTQARLKEVLNYDPDTGIFTWIKPPSRRVGVNDPAGTILNIGYIHISIDRKRYVAHRLAWFFTHGEWPKEQMDHINHNRIDNRISNLRCVSYAENRKNMKLFKLNKSGHDGVWWDKSRNKWQAFLDTGGKRIHLGRHVKKHDAIAAREKAKSERGYHPNHGKVCT